VVVGVTDDPSLSFTFDLEGLTPSTTYYFSAFAGASMGEILSFTTTELDAPPVIASGFEAEFISVHETGRNTRIWEITFIATEIFASGETDSFEQRIQMPNTDANLNGAYTFEHGRLQGFTLVFDIRNNGSNIVVFELRESV